MMNTHYKHSSSDNFLKQLPESLTEAKSFIEDKLNKLTDRKNELLASNSISSTHRHLLELKRLLKKLDLEEFSELFPKDYDLYDAHRYSNYVTKLNQWKALERERFKDDLLDVVNHIALYQLLYHAKHYTGQSDQVVSSLLNTLDSLYAVTDKEHRLLNGFEKRIEAIKSEHQNLINRLDEFEKSVKTINSEHKQFFHRFDGVEESVKSVDARLANLTNRFDGIEESINSVNSEVANQANRLDGFEESVEQLNAKFDKIDKIESKIRKGVAFVEKFSSYLESYKKKKEAFTYLLFFVIIGLVITVLFSGIYFEYSLTQLGKENNLLKTQIATLDDKFSSKFYAVNHQLESITASVKGNESLLTQFKEENSLLNAKIETLDKSFSKELHDVKSQFNSLLEIKLAELLEDVNDRLKGKITTKIVLPSNLEQLVANMIKEKMAAQQEYFEKRLEEEEKYQDEIIEHTIEKLGELEEEQQIEY